MREKITRRDFLKIAGIGSAASVLLDGCGEGTNRRLVGGMREYLIRGKEDCYATTCDECPRGCGLLVHTSNGRIRWMEGNPKHPINQGTICEKGLAALEHLNNPNRIPGPLRQIGRGSGSLAPMDWRAARSLIRNTLHKYAPGEMAFLLGLFPDHVNDLVQLLSRSLGGIKVLRLNSCTEMEGCVTLMDATRKLFGAWKILHFDIEHAKLIFSFGSNLSESWFPPNLQRAIHNRGSRLVYFGARLPDTIGEVDEWLPIRPGSEAILAQVLARLVSDHISCTGSLASTMIDLNPAAESSGVPATEIKRLARLFAQAPTKVAIPGSFSLGNSDGLALAQAILTLNVAAGNLGKEGGIFLPPDSPIYPELSNQPSTIAEVSALIETMKGGQVKALLIHGANPVYDLPRSFGFEEAMRNVELVISFASFRNKTAMKADYIYPDHISLEGWGYQKTNPGGNRLVISGIQPVVQPVFDTRSTAELLLSATRGLGGEIAASIPFVNEVDFLQKSLASLLDREGSYTAPSPDLFWRHWLESGGWWETSPRWIPPVVCSSIDHPWNSLDVKPIAEDQYYLLPLHHPSSRRRKQTNRLDSRLIQRSIPQVEIHKQTSHSLGLHNNDVVKISSPSGEIRAVVQEVNTIRPDTIAVVIEKEDSVFPSSREYQRENLLDLLGKAQNESGDLAFAAGRVKVGGI